MIQVVLAPLKFNELITRLIGCWPPVDSGKGFAKLHPLRYVFTVYREYK